MKALRDKARELLELGEVQVVIGYGQGRRGVRPIFVTRPQDCEQLVFDPRCVQNLASYLNPRRAHVKRLGRPAVVVKGCDCRAVAGLIRESQIARGDVVLLGVRCGGVVVHPHGPAELTADTVAPRCQGCDIREPQLPDELLGELPPPPPEAPGIAERVAALDALPVDERMAFWKAQFSRCIRCYACRQACPLCYCARCIADFTQPRWIDSSAHARGNTAWNHTRAMHLAGRCAGCSECERACPQGIPLTLLNEKLAQVGREQFEHRVGDDPDVPAPVGDFRKGDAEEFIV